MDKKLTRSGIAYDLTISPHKLVLDYEKHSIEYVFSSEFYKTKFLEKLEDNRNTINQALSKKYGFTIENNILSDIRLYSHVEKRGFLLNSNGKSYECLNIIKLSGVNLI